MASNLTKALDASFLIDLVVAGGAEALDTLSSGLTEGAAFTTEAIINEIRANTTITASQKAAIEAWSESGSVKVVTYVDSTTRALPENSSQALINATKKNAGERGLLELTTGKKITEVAGQVSVGETLDSAVDAMRAADLPHGNSVLLISEGAFPQNLANSTTKAQGFAKFGLVDPPVNSAKYVEALLSRGFDVDKVKAWNTVLRDGNGAGVGLNNKAVSEIMSDAQVDDYKSDLLNRTGTNPADVPWYKLAKYSFLITVANKLGLVGDVLSLVVTAANAEDLREDNKEQEANETWMKFLFETTGGFVAGFATLVVLNKFLPSPHPYAIIAKFGLTIGASIIGSWGGAALGEFVYDTAQNTLDDYFSELYARIDAIVEADPDSVAETIAAFFGFDGNGAEGTDSDDFHVADKWDHYAGKDGNDIIVGFSPEFVSVGQKIDPDNANSELAKTELRMELHGDAGDDILIALGGTGPILVGGEGRVFLFNTSYKGQLWGDGFGGRPVDNPDTPENENLGDSDVFWYWPGTFIMDAQQNDILQMFGLPLLGGSNTFGGIPFGDGSWAVDWLNFFTFYTVRGDNQLVIHNALFDIITRGSDEYDILNSAMIVENFHFGGFQTGGGSGEAAGDGGNIEWGVPKTSDLGMTFRLVLEKDNPNGVEVSVWNAIWGHLITQVTALTRLAKLVNWQPADDPLVLDLDGDGIETVSVDQSGVHFDLDGDYFAEKTGWVAADDGFLVRDLNGNGLIDDITEMFGAPGVSAYSELAELDKVENGGNADGFITLDDAAFSQLQVWRDLDQDGETDAGELFTLAELDIVSISVTGDGVESITPTGTTLREGASFTFGDGTTGNTYEAIFETDATDTIFRGEKGVAEWQRINEDSSGGGSPGSGPGQASGGNIKSVIPDAKGLGSMADLAVQAASDFALADTILAATSAMGLDANGLPSLKQLRADAAPVYGAWSQSMELTRELVPVLLNKAVDGTDLIDRAIYVEDATGGFWQLESGNVIVDGNGAVISRATLEDVLAQSVDGDQVWQMEQMFSPTSRAAPLAYREEAPYLATIVDGRAVISDYGIDNGDGSWRLASGNAIVDGNGVVIASPSVADILAMPIGGGSGDGSGATNGGSTEEWRIEAFDFNPYADLPVEEMGVYLIDGTVVDYSIAVTDADGTFHVWSRNLDRALELQHKLGQPGDFALRNYEIDFDNLDEVGSTDDSAYRVEILTAGQFHFASSIFGIDFQPKIMSAVTDPLTGVLSYSVGSFNGVEASQVNDDGSYLSVIDPAIELFDALMQNYIDVSRGFAVRLALQGGLSRFARGLNYEAVSDEFTSSTDRELAPMFEAIFEEAPAGATESYDYLVAWREILQVVYPDYHLDGTTNFVTGTLELDEEFVFQMLLPAFENVGIDADLAAVMNALGVDETKLISHDAAATLVNGTDGDDFIYLSAGNQTYRGGYGADTYFAGKNFGQDIIEDVEEPLNPWSADILRFTQAKSTDVFATRDGLDLVIEVLGTTDVLRIKGQFDGEKIDPIFGADFSNDTEMVSIVFADGVIWDRFEIAKAVSHPLDSDDLVLGSQAKDLLEGGKGNDIMRGGRDGDIYIIRAGDGIDIIDDDNDMPTDDPTEKPDLLQFVGDFSAEDLSLKRIADSDDLEITLLDVDGNPTGDVVTIEGQFGWINVFFLGLMFPDTIERIAFSDGSFLTETDIMARVLDEAKTDAADAIHGFNNADTLDGGAGDDILSGHAQDDIYIYGRDYGRDVILDDDDDFLANSYDVLKFQDDLRWTDFVFEREGASSTITMRVEGTQDAVILQDQYKHTFLLGFSNLIERFDFADGTSWDHTKLAQHVIDLSSTDGADTLYGFAIADRLDGGAGDDRLEGLGGADTYVFARGYGNDTVFDIAKRLNFDYILSYDLSCKISPSCSCFSRERGFDF